MGWARAWMEACVVVAALTSSPLGQAEEPPAKCEPPCRRGFSCVGERCASDCNPPCLAGEVCTAELECVVREEADEIEDSDSIRLHDAFYARLGLGVGLLQGDIVFHDFTGIVVAGQEEEPTEGTSTRTVARVHSIPQRIAVGIAPGQS
jgi:hypothetical protein